MNAGVRIRRVSGRGCRSCRRIVRSVKVDVSRWEEFFPFPCVFCGSLWLVESPGDLPEESGVVVGSASQCCGCGKFFELLSGSAGVPEGCMVEGRPCCWDCVEKVAAEIEREAQVVKR